MCVVSTVKTDKATSNKNRNGQLERWQERFGKQTKFASSNHRRNSRRMVSGRRSDRGRNRRNVEIRVRESEKVSRKMSAFVVMMQPNRVHEHNINLILARQHLSQMIDGTRHSK